MSLQGLGLLWLDNISDHNVVNLDSGEVNFIKFLLYHFLNVKRFLILSEFYFVEGPQFLSNTQALVSNGGSLGEGLH